MRGSSAIYLPSDRNDYFLLSIADGVVIQQSGPRQALPHSVRCPIESKLDVVRVEVVTPSVRLEASAGLSFGVDLLPCAKMAFTQHSYLNQAAD
jgi:hypothetical protein